jgi:hypothetical protein
MWTTPAWKRSWCGCVRRAGRVRRWLTAHAWREQERMDSGISADDRRAALAELKDLLASNAQAQLAVGHIGLHVLCAVLREDRDDVQLVRGALEALLQAVTRSAEQAPGGVEPSAVNAELLARDGRNLVLVLGLLDDEDFYVRYHALQLLCGLLGSAAHHVQAMVLTNPLGVLRLLDMVSEREAIRNEALLLLNSLTQGREEIQKILAFEGALERLFGIVADEGGTEGGVVVQDCLELINNLLRGCAPNQMLFREGGLARNLPALLALRVGTSAALSRQAAANVLCSLELVFVLLAADGDAAAVAANQAALLKAGVLEALLPLALGSQTRFPAVRSAARLCAAALVGGFAAAQEALGAASVASDADSEPPSPALLVALQAVLSGSDDSERSAAERLVAAYCEGNPVGQRLLVSTLTPMGDADADARASFGAMLAAALVDGAAELACRAASLLQHLLLDNLAAKEHLLRMPLEAPGVLLPELFMPRCTRMLAEAARAADARSGELQVALLRLLFVWVQGCPAAVAGLLASPAHLPLLIDLASRADVHVAGFAAAVLSCCVLDNNTVGDCDAHTVLDTIVSRVTLAEYFRRWEAMRASEAFVAAVVRTSAGRPLVTRASVAAAVDGGASFAGGTHLYSHALALLLEQLEQAVRSGLLALYARPKQIATRSTAVWEVGETESEQAHIARLKALLQAADAELAELRARNGTLAQQLLLGQPPTVASAADAAPSAASGAEEQLQAVVARVRQEAERDIAAARAEAAEARSAGARHEESLTALSQAYNTLEAAHFRFEEELRQSSSGKRDGVTPEQLRAAVAAARQEGVTEGGAQAAAAHEQALADAAAEHEQELSDLLVCLGQEEAKVSRLCEALRSAGVPDVDALLAAADEDA